nr:DUF4336 domain-containing protein [Hoeflea marina]
MTAFASEIWLADGPAVTVPGGFRYPTRMAVIRLRGGDLVLWSPVAISDELHAAVDALGRVRYLAPPNSLHHVFLGDWQRAYPDAVVLAPPGLRRKRPDIRFDSDFADGQVQAWAGEIEHVVVGGNWITTEVVFFHWPSRTAIFTDLLQQFPPGWFGGWRRLVARFDLMLCDEPSVPRKFRLAFRDRAAARRALARSLAWPAERVLMAHGEPVTSDGQAYLRRAFSWLRP